MLQVRAAQAAGVPVVHPDWLVACRYAWKRVPELAFSLQTYKPVAGSRSASSRAAALAAERAAVMKTAGRVGPG